MARLCKQALEINFLIAMTAGEFPTTKTTSTQGNGLHFSGDASFFSKKNGSMTQTGLTFRLQLTVIAPVMDQMNRGCHNGRGEQAVIQQSYLTFSFVYSHDTHTLSFPLNDRH